MSEPGFDLGNGCICAENWRVYLVGRGDSPGGPILDVIDNFTSLDFEMSFITPGAGTITFFRGVDDQSGATIGTRYRMQDIYPHAALIYIERVTGGSASFDQPVTMFAGLIETLSMDISGMVTLGFSEITRALDYMHLWSTDKIYVNEPQTDIAADLVFDLPLAGLMPLFAVSNPNAPVLRDRTYRAAEARNLGEVIQQLTQVINGPVYELVHIRQDNTYRTEIVFSDVLVAAGRAHVVLGDLTGYTLTLDSNEHATDVLGFGAVPDGAEDPIMFGPVASSNPPLVPFFRFDAVPSWDDVSVPATLEEHVEGYAEDHKDLVGACSLTLSGLDHPGIDYFRAGYPINVFVHGANLTFASTDGSTHIDTVSVSVSDAGEQITLGCSSVMISEATIEAEDDFPPTGCVDC